MLECARMAQIGGGWNMRKRIIRNNKNDPRNIRSQEGLDCWRVEGLPDDLTSNQYPPHKYTKDIDKYGPKFHDMLFGTRNFTRSPVAWLFDITSVSPAKLIQLAFHDCLRYSHETIRTSFLFQGLD